MQVVCVNVCDKNRHFIITKFVLFSFELYTHSVCIQASVYCNQTIIMWSSLAWRETKPKSKRDRLCTCIEKRWRRRRMVHLHTCTHILNVGEKEPKVETACVAREKEEMICSKTVSFRFLYRFFASLFLTYTRNTSSNIFAFPVQQIYTLILFSKDRT